MQANKPLSMTNIKSDLDAKTAFCKHLESMGFTTEIRQAPADIRAMKDGQEWFFEIKKTSQDKDYFGAATSTEWEQAFKDPAHYRFVICQKLADGSFKFIKFTPAQMMEYSTIPPFKIFFNVPLDGKEKKVKGVSKALRLTQEAFTALNNMYKHLKG